MIVFAECTGNCIFTLFSQQPILANLDELSLIKQKTHLKILKNLSNKLGIDNTIRYSFKYKELFRWVSFFFVANLRVANLARFGISVNFQDSVKSSIQSGSSPCIELQMFKQSTHLSKVAGLQVHPFTPGKSKTHSYQMGSGIQTKKNIFKAKNQVTETIFEISSNFRKMIQIM